MKKTIIFFSFSFFFHQEWKECFVIPTVALKFQNMSVADRHVKYFLYLSVNYLVGFNSP